MIEAIAPLQVICKVTFTELFDKINSAFTAGSRTSYMIIETECYNQLP